MALHDFRCSACGGIAVDVNVPISQGALAAVVVCPNDQTRMDWIPATRAMDVGGVKGAAFKAFETYDGRNQKVTVTNVRQLRQIERESEQLHRNGEGQPIVFRAWANDRSNRDQSALHPHFAGGEQPTAAAKHRYGSTLQKSVEAPVENFGPGVDATNASALPMEPT